MTIVKNAGIASSITVTGLTDSDIIKVYDSQTNGNLIGTTIARLGKTVGIVSTAKLIVSGGNIYISITSKGMSESSRISVSYQAVQKTFAPAPASINVVNNVGIISTKPM